MGNEITNEVTNEVTNELDTALDLTKIKHDVLDVAIQLRNADASYTNEHAIESLKKIVRYINSITPDIK